MEDGAHVDSIYFYFSKAFDQVDFGILSRKMKKIGIQGNLQCGSTTSSKTENREK